VGWGRPARKRKGMGGGGPSGACTLSPCKKLLPVAVGEDAAADQQSERKRKVSTAAPPPPPIHRVIIAPLSLVSRSSFMTGRTHRSSW
jgi:hypothetical protein